MKNCTVAGLIEILKKMDQSAIVCKMEMEHEEDEPVFLTFEMCKEFKDVHYTDDIGDDKIGSIVAIY